MSNKHESLTNIDLDFIYLLFKVLIMLKKICSTVIHLNAALRHNLYEKLA